ncbi:hypothetical protein HGB38_35195 [Nocardia gamkensis]|uniref:UspA domain-containing protein n=1 Tax=Nocardia gamkensis TaxID=352869 RepID=A0A7X6LCB1_9NOCA|nr:hypothetical protein [Nocardia gamkensis]
MVGIDGFDTSPAAAKWAAALAGKLALPLHLMHSTTVRGLIPDYPGATTCER